MNEKYPAALICRFLLRVVVGIVTPLAALFLPVLVVAQTDAYIVEVFEAHDEQEQQAPAEEQTFTISQPDFSYRGSTTMREDGRIGSARGATRSGRGGGTMLRYDQHRALSPPASSTLRVGPWYTDLGVALSGGYRYSRFRGRGTDFLDGTRRGEVQKGGSELPLSATLTMNNYMLLTRRLDLSLNLRMSYYHYPLGTQPDLFVVDLTDEGLYATFSTQFHPTRDSRILFYDDILYLTDFVDRRGISDRLGGRAYRLLQNTVGADWDWRASTWDVFSASVSRSDSIPQSRAFRNQRAIRYAEMGAYRRQINPFAAGGVALQASQSLGQTADRPDSYIHGYSIFSGLNLTQAMNVNASIGQQFAVVQGGDLEESLNRQSIVGSVSLDHDLQAGRSQRFSVSRAIVESFEGSVDISDTFDYRLGWSGMWLPGSFSSGYAILDPQDEDRNGYRNWNNTLQVRTQLTRMVPLSFSASYVMRFNESLREESAPASNADAEIGSDYQTLSLMARTGFQIMRKINFTAYVQHVRRTADNAQLAYTRDTVGLQLTWSHTF